MGTILRGTCPRCGYQEDVLTGGGLRDCNPEAALSAASGDQGLATALSAHGQFRIQRFPTICIRCHKLITASQVTYWMPDGEEHTTQAACPLCGSSVIQGRELPCPVCGRTMKLSTVGHWD